MLCFGIMSLVGCGEEQESETLQADKTVQNTESFQASKSEQEIESQSAKEENRMKVSIGNSVFTATLENNSAVDSLIEMMKNEPLVIDMSDYSGFEKVGSLGKTLPANNRQTTTQSGDIVLYNGDQIVIFYGSNSWSYTRIGRIDDLSGWEDALGRGSVTVTFSIE
ncbi:MAG: hypothetical protein K2M60_02065 [Lachnospiraceae bacterium]|nr:hypothetical protein [Lachnospiraceae bacterium]MDE6252059.1 hypothetical protein [Lachnospiraceae bacterium]